MRSDEEEITSVDCLIIGGGINGAGIAAEAASRGLTVCLCEQNDLGSGTSSRSSKLIHGGLRYLEYYEFRLVREALQEREILLRKAPHIIQPLSFVLPHQPDLKPAWLLRLGLFLYDHLGKRRSLPHSYSIDLRHHPIGRLLNESLQRAFIYADCQVDDARLVVLNAMQASQFGAHILTRTQIIAAKREHGIWQIQLKSNHGHIQKITAKALINAAGPWAMNVLQGLHLPAKHHITLVKGSHIVVPKLYDGDFAFILPNADKRVIFVIPYCQQYSLIGTTELPFQGDPDTATITPEEVSYLCTAVNSYFKQSIGPEHIVWQYSGVRPLQADAEQNNLSAISRDYTLELNTVPGQAPLISVFGGKITTYRRLAIQALTLLQPFFPEANSILASEFPLPGGDMPTCDFNAFLRQFRQQYAWLPEPLACRLAHSYGTLAEKIMRDAKKIAELGRCFGANLYEREVIYLIQNEWAQSAEDILWRRTKLGLQFSPEEAHVLHSAILDFRHQRGCSPIG